MRKEAGPSRWILSETLRGIDLNIGTVSLHFNLVSLDERLFLSRVTRAYECK